MLRDPSLIRRAYPIDDSAQFVLLPREQAIGQYGEPVPVPRAAMHDRRLGIYAMAVLPALCALVDQPDPRPRAVLLEQRFPGQISDAQYDDGVQNLVEAGVLAIDGDAWTLLLPVRGE